MPQSEVLNRLRLHRMLRRDAHSTPPVELLRTLPGGVHEKPQSLTPRIGQITSLAKRRTGYVDATWPKSSTNWRTPRLAQCCCVSSHCADSALFWGSGASRVTLMVMSDGPSYGTQTIDRQLIYATTSSL